MDKEKTDSFETRVKRALDSVRPYIQGDGGDVELIEIDEDNKNVLIKMVGACEHCAMSEITLKHGIEEAIREEIPEINKIITL